MKKVMVCISMGFALLACTKEIQIPVEPQDNAVLSDVSVIAPLNVELTRTTTTWRSDGGLSTTFDIGTETGDEIGVYVEVPAVNYVVPNLKFKATAEVADKPGWADFKQLEGMQLANGYKLYAYYPYSREEVSVIGGGDTRASAEDVSRLLSVNPVQNVGVITHDITEDFTYAIPVDHLKEYDILATKEPVTIENKTAVLSFTHVFRPERIGFRNRTDEDLTISGFTFKSEGSPIAGDFKVNLETLAFTEANAVDEITVNFDQITVHPGEELFAAVVIAAPVALNDVVITVVNSDGRIFEGHKDYAGRVLPNDNVYRIAIDLAPAGDKYQLVESVSDLSSGVNDYVLAYRDGSNFKLFSFAKTMENAEDGASQLADVHGLDEIYHHITDFTGALLNQNYETVVAGSNPKVLYLTEAQSGAVISMNYNSTLGGTTSFSTTTEDGNSYTLGFSDIKIALNDNSSAKISAIVDGAGLVTIANQLRGNPIGYTVGDLLTALGQKMNLTPDQQTGIEDIFDSLCETLKNKSQTAFPVQIDITRSTNVAEAFAAYYSLAATFSEDVAPNKKFGLAYPIGFYAAGDGFKSNIPMPESIWFDRLEESMQGDLDDFVTYWSGYDSNPAYAEVSATLCGLLGYQGQGFFNLAANKIKSLLENKYGGSIGASLAFGQLKSMPFATMKNKYSTIKNLVNDELGEVYIYKKVTE